MARATEINLIVSLTDKRGAIFVPGGTEHIETAGARCRAADILRGVVTVPRCRRAPVMIGCCYGRSRCGGEFVYPAQSGIVGANSARPRAAPPMMFFTVFS